MRKTINYPFESAYKKFECYFRVYKPDNNGDINITLRLNVINDRTTYRWTYGNVKDCDIVGEKTFFKPLRALLDELHKLEYCWEWEGDPNDREYIIGSHLYYVPIYDGNENKIEISKDREGLISKQTIKSDGAAVIMVGHGFN